MTTQLIACTSFSVGANLFARHRTPGPLLRDDKHPSPNPRSLTLQPPSHRPSGLFAPGQANKFAPTKATLPTARKIHPGRQNGFTLIELIMVIITLGILSALALPRFFDVSADARAARVNAGLGAARSALAIVNAEARLSGIGMGEVEQQIFLEGQAIAVKFGYPAQPYSLLIAAGMDADFDGAGADGIVHKNSYDLGTGRCGFRYIPPTTAGEAPRFEPWPGSSLPITAADCRRN
ncbi:type II secretion system protein [Stutzerimonas nitrititolerans]|uniref:type II secretion system protein n=1 Tax=Stutzerimonas nitrititolerans TaxID=2482751 RepID=UPI003AA7D3CE